MTDDSGEGMKVGIIALLRQGVKVYHYTNKEIWEWKFGFSQGRRILCIQADKSEPIKAKVDPNIDEVTRQGRRNAAKDTTVIVQGIEETDIVLSDYLFLVKPPPEVVFTTDIGSLLTGDEYRGKIYVKGVFVEERTTDDPPPLRYGVNFSRAALDRDRRSVMTGSAVATSLSKMWDTVISEDQTGTAAMYLDLLLAGDDQGYLEVLHAFRSISRASADILLRELRNRFPDKFFYCADEVQAIEVRITWTRLIEARQDNSRLSPSKSGADLEKTA